MCRGGRGTQAQGDVAPGWPAQVAEPGCLGVIRGSPCPQVQLSESKRELTELRSALRVLQKEKEQLQEEKQVRAWAWAPGCQKGGLEAEGSGPCVSWLRHRGL